MPAFICAACGTQYPPSEAPPGTCPVCIDERQFVPASGQSWTTLEGLRNGHSNKFRRLATGLTTIETTPAFAIGQRAILAHTPAGNVLWECIALVDDATVDLLNGLGGVKAIAISHPHYYTTMVEWSRALGGVPIHLHAADRQWVMRPDPAVQFWDGDSKPIGPGLTLIRLGGHFAGGTVLHWADWSEGRGVLLSGDILQVVPSRHVSFMWSYPNLIPLSAATFGAWRRSWSHSHSTRSTARFPAAGRSTQTASRSSRRRWRVTSRGSARHSLHVLIGEPVPTSPEYALVLSPMLASRGDPPSQSGAEELYRPSPCN